MKKIIWPLILLALTQITLNAKYRDQASKNVVKVQIINNSTYETYLTFNDLYMEDMIWLTTKDFDNVTNRDPFFKWIKPNTKEVYTSSSEAPRGNAYIHYTRKENPGIFTYTPHEIIQLDGKSKNQSFKNININTVATPIIAHYESIIWGPYTHTFYNYTITITDSQYKNEL